MSRKFIAFDVETTGLLPHKDRLYSISICWEEDHVEAFGAWELPKHFIDALEDPNIDKVGHRIRFDAKFIIKAGIKLRGRLWCTKIQAHLLNENEPNGLKDLSTKYFGAESLDGKRELDAAISQAGVKSIDRLTALDLDDPLHPYKNTILKYNCEDAHNTLKLFYVQSEKMRAVDKTMKETLGCRQTILDYYVKESMPAESVLMKMELEGINTNPQVLNELKITVDRKRNELLELLRSNCSKGISTVEQHLYETALAKRTTPAGKAKVVPSSDAYKTAFNWGSNQHVGSLFFGCLLPNNRWAKKTKNGSWDTSETAFKVVSESLGANHPTKAILTTFAEYKKTGKILSTYIGEGKGLVSHVHEGKIYANYDPYTVTGRLSSSSPNMQNLPRGGTIKRFFVPTTPGNVFLYFDYSQVEMRLAAHLSQDPAMLEVFHNNLDPHKMLAAKVFSILETLVSKEQRQVGKTANFLLIFKGTAWRLQQELKDKNGLDYSIEMCEEFVRAFFDTYKRLGQYLDEQLEFMKRYHRVICETGRVRRLPDIIYGNHLDWRNKEFTGPSALRAHLQNLIDTKQVPKPVLEEQPQQQLFKLAAMKFSHAKKQGFNMPIQGLSASVTKRALIALYKKGYNSRTTVHDSIAIELSPQRAVDEFEKIQHILENVYPCSVPLKVEGKILNSLDESDVHPPGTPLKKFA